MKQTVIEGIVYGLKLNGVYCALIQNNGDNLALGLDYSTLDAVIYQDSTGFLVEIYGATRDSRGWLVQDETPYKTIRTNGIAGVVYAIAQEVKIDQNEVKPE